MTAELPMHRMAVLERMARAFCVRKGEDPDRDFRGRGVITLSLAVAPGKEVTWSKYEADMKAALDVSGLMERIAKLEAELKREDAALRFIAFGDAQEWPGCSSRKVAEAALSPAPSDHDAHEVSSTPL